MKNQELIEIKQNIFFRIKNFFKNILKKFNNKSTNSVEEYDNIEDVFADKSQNVSNDKISFNDNENISKNENDNDNNNSLDYLTEKKRILKLYNDVKFGKVNIEDVDIVDTIILCNLINEEINLKLKSIN